MTQEDIKAAQDLPGTLCEIAFRMDNEGYAQRAHFQGQNGISPDDLFDWSDDLKRSADAIRQLLSRVEALEAAQKWQPIETAPDDGTEVFLAEKIDGEDWSIFVGFWNEDRDENSYVTKWQLSEYSAFSYKPTHWMPLALPPALQQDKGGVMSKPNHFERALEALTLELKITDEQMFNLIAMNQACMMEATAAKDAEIARLRDVLNSSHGLSLCDFCSSWRSKPCGEGCHWQPAALQSKEGETK